MPEYPLEIEIERIMNLVRGFGWSEIKREVVGDKLILTIEKTFLKAEEVPEEIPAT